MPHTVVTIDTLAHTLSPRLEEMVRLLVAYEQEIVAQGVCAVEFHCGTTPREVKARLVLPLPKKVRTRCIVQLPRLDKGG